MLEISTSYLLSLLIILHYHLLIHWQLIVVLRRRLLLLPTVVVSLMVIHLILALTYGHLLLIVIQLIRRHPDVDISDVLLMWNSHLILFQQLLLLLIHSHLRLQNLLLMLLLLEILLPLVGDRLLVVLPVRCLVEVALVHLLSLVFVELLIVVNRPNVVLL